MTSSLNNSTAVRMAAAKRMIPTELKFVVVMLAQGP